METTAIYFILNRKGLREGPYSLEVLKKKRLTRDTLVCQHFGSWRRAGEIPELEYLFRDKQFMNPLRDFRLPKVNLSGAQKWRVGGVTLLVATGIILLFKMVNASSGIRKTNDQCKQQIQVLTKQADSLEQLIPQLMNRLTKLREDSSSHESNILQTKKTEDIERRQILELDTNLNLQLAWMTGIKNRLAQKPRSNKFRADSLHTASNISEISSDLRFHNGLLDTILKTQENENEKLSAVQEDIQKLKIRMANIENEVQIIQRQRDSLTILCGVRKGSIQPTRDQTVDRIGKGLYSTDN